jgi:RNA polymerase primary sigma factor
MEPSRTDRGSTLIRCKARGVRHFRRAHDVRLAAGGLEAWRAAGQLGVVEAVIGAGKTRVGMAAIADHARRLGKALVLVPAIRLQQQWLEALRMVLPRVKAGALGDAARAALREVDVLVATVHSALPRPTTPPAALYRPVGGRRVPPLRRGNFRQALQERFERRPRRSATFEGQNDRLTAHLEPHFSGVCYSVG